MFLLLIIASAVNLLILLQYKSKKKANSTFALTALPHFPEHCNFYYDVKTGKLCRRCEVKGKQVEIKVRKRFQLSRESEILRIKRLTSIYSCNECTYKALDKIK